MTGVWLALGLQLGLGLGSVFFFTSEKIFSYNLKSKSCYNIIDDRVRGKV